MSGYGDGDGDGYGYGDGDGYGYGSGSGYGYGDGDGYGDGYGYGDWPVVLTVPHGDHSIEILSCGAARVGCQVGSLDWWVANGCRVARANGTRITRAALLRCDAACNGLFGLAAAGPKADTRLTPAVATTTTTEWRQTLAVSPESAAAMDVWP